MTIDPVNSKRSGNCKASVIKSVSKNRRWESNDVNMIAKITQYCIPLLLMNSLAFLVKDLIMYRKQKNVNSVWIKMIELSESTNELEIAKKIGYNGGIRPKSGTYPFEKKNEIPA